MAHGEILVRLVKRVRSKLQEHLREDLWNRIS